MQSNASFAEKLLQQKYSVPNSGEKKGNINLLSSHPNGTMKNTALPIFRSDSAKKFN